MEKKKMTYATALNNVLNANPAVDAETLDRLNDLLAQVSKKYNKTTDGEQTTKRAENEVLADKAFDQMESNRNYGLTELVKELPVSAEYEADSGKPMNTSKMAVLMGILIDGGKVVKETIKRKNYYSKI